MKLFPKVLKQIKNTHLSKIIKENYEKNQEFQELIDQIIKNKFNFLNLDKFKNIIFEYLDSYSLCQTKTNYKCQQFVEGYRLSLKINQNHLFLILKKCLHKKSTESLKQNYFYADFPQELIKPDLKKDILNLQNKERGLLINYFMNILNPTINMEKKWLFLNGEIGTGKTFLTVFFANAFINKTDKRVFFINTNNLFSIFRRSIFEKTELTKELCNKLNNADLLVIDDLGNENRLISFRDEFLFPLISNRHNKKLLTFFLSNLSYDNLKNFYTFSRDKIETIKAKTFFNLLNQNCHFMTLKKLFKK